MASDIYADHKYGGGENGEIKEACDGLLALQDANVTISLRGKERRNAGVAGGQIWRWKSHNERVTEPTYMKGIEVGYNISVCTIIVPAKCHGVSDQAVKKRRAQNRAAQKAFRARQKRTYHDLEARNDELANSMKEALQEISRLRSLVDSMSLEMKTYKERKSTGEANTKQSVCSAKCSLPASTPQETESAPQPVFGMGEDLKSAEYAWNARHPQTHTNSRLFRSTGTATSDQYSSKFSSASNEAVATVLAAKHMCNTPSDSNPQSIPNPGNVHVSRQAPNPESVPWLAMDATLDDVQATSSKDLRSLSCSSLHEMGLVCGISMNCLSCSALQQGYDSYSRVSSNFASTSTLDHDMLETPLTSPGSNVDVLPLCTYSPRQHPRSTDANGSSARSSASFEEASAVSSDHTLPSSFGLGEMDWFETPY